MLLVLQRLLILLVLPVMLLFMLLVADAARVALVHATCVASARMLLAFLVFSLAVVLVPWVYLPDDCSDVGVMIFDVLLDTTDMFISHTCS